MAMPTEKKGTLVCFNCHRTPEEITEYTPAMTGETGLLADPEEYVWDQEGTLNRENGHFACTECYIRIGQPSSPTGWKAP